MSELLDDTRFTSNAKRVAQRHALEKTIDQCFASLTRAEVMARLDAAKIANGEINDVAAVAQHPQLTARRRWVHVQSPSGEIPALLPPHNLESAPSQMRPVPALGEHSQEILAELGFRSEK